MAQKRDQFSHTKWLCKYHIVFTPKYRRKIIYSELRKDIGMDHSQYSRQKIRRNHKESKYSFSNSFGVL